MSYSYLGQTQTTTTTTVIQRVPVPVISFARRIQTGTPGQLYQTTFDTTEVEKEIYKDIPTAVKKEKEILGANPQKIITHESGLEIPAYILQRDIERKKEAERAAIEEASIVIPLPQFHKIGVFISQKPLLSSLIVAALGYFSGQYYYKSKRPK